MKMFTYGIYISMIFLFNSSVACAQYWINNEAVEFLEDRIVNDLVFVDNLLWVSSEQIMKIDGKEIYKYDIDDSSEGKLGDYESIDIDAEPRVTYYELHADNSTLCLYKRNSRTLLKILDEEIYNYDFDLFKDEKLYIDNVAIDKNNNLWFIVHKYVNYSSSVWYTQDDEVVEYKIPYGIDSLEINLFFINNEKKFFIISKYNEKIRARYPKLIIIDENDSVIEHELGEYFGPMEHKYSINNKDIFILDGKGMLYNIDNKLNLTKKKTPLNSLKSCYWFLADGEDIYFSYRKGLSKYNYVSGEGYHIFLSGNRSEGMLGFKNLILRDGEIWGDYVGWNGFYECNILAPGIGTLRLEYYKSKGDRNK